MSEELSINVSKKSDLIAQGKLLALSSEDHPTVYFNASKELILLKAPSLQECGEILEEFRSLQLGWLKTILALPNKKKSHIALFSGSSKKGTTSSEILNFAPRLFGLEGLGEDFWGCFSYPLKEGEPRSLVLEKATMEEQMKAFEFVSTDFQTLAKQMKGTASPSIRSELESWLDTCESGIDFINKLYEDWVVQDEATLEELSKKMGMVMEERSSIASLLLAFMASKGFLLLPPSRRIIIGMKYSEIYNLAEKLMNPFFQKSRQEVLTSKVYKEYSHFSKQEIERTLIAVAVSSTISQPIEVNEKVFDPIRKSILEHGIDKVKEAQTKITKIYQVISHAEASALSIKKKESEEVCCSITGNPIPPAFAWVTYRTMDKGNIRKFPAQLQNPEVWNNFNPSNGFESLAFFVNLLLKTLDYSQNKRLGANYGSLKVLIAWIVEHGDFNDDLDFGVIPSRKMINDGLPVNQGKCFRSWLYGKYSTETANKILSNLNIIFDILYETTDQQNTPFKGNPIKLNMDSFIKQVNRSKTVRTAISKEIIDKLLEINAGNDFALSKSMKQHFRSVFVPEKQKRENLWFPAYAIILELLLTLPMRSRQARFLDSGERDEWLVEKDAQGKVVAIKNEKGEKGICHGVFYKIDAFGEESKIGLRVNTNKHASGSEEGYSIPWLSDRLYGLLKQMGDWQKKYNPNYTLIENCEKVDLDKMTNQEAIDSLKKVAPLFRDPADPDGWVITASALSQYWSKVVAKTQEQLRKEGKDVVIAEKNKNGRMASLYDLHSLRVSGITNLIALGVPPDLMQVVAGHKSLAMTLYYNKVEASKVSQKLAHFLCKEQQEKLLNNSKTDLGDLEVATKELFNLYNSEIPRDMAMNRKTFGDGSFLVMAHGICPGGACEQGGQKDEPLRPMACSLCKFRLTGPAFLPGMILKANTLIHEMREIGLKITALNEEIELRESQNKPVFQHYAKKEGLERESESIAKEWAFEYQYIKASEKWYQEHAGERSAPIVYGQLPEVECRLEEISPLELLQRLAEGHESEPDVVPPLALLQHQEYINEILMASNLNPFLLSLKGEIKAQASILLGKAITAMVPTDDEIERLHKGESSLDSFPAFQSFYHQVQQASSNGSLSQLMAMRGHLPQKITNKGEQL